jgi:hypothetical protein
VCELPACDLPVCDPRPQSRFMNYGMEMEYRIAVQDTTPLHTERDLRVEFLG